MREEISKSLPMNIPHQPSFVCRIIRRIWRFEESHLIKNSRDIRTQSRELATRLVLVRMDPFVRPSSAPAVIQTNVCRPMENIIRVLQRISITLNGSLPLPETTFVAACNRIQTLVHFSVGQDTTYLQQLAVCFCYFYLLSLNDSLTACRCGRGKESPY